MKAIEVVEVSVIAEVCALWIAKEIKAVEMIAEVEWSDNECSFNY